MTAPALADDGAGARRPDNVSALLLDGAGAPRPDSVSVGLPLALDRLSSPVPRARLAEFAAGPASGAVLDVHEDIA